METDDPPEFFDCVYVQTEKDLNLFSLEDGYLMSELQLKLHNMDGVALQHMGKYSQVQIFSHGRVTALYIHGKAWIDPVQTEAVYRWLTDHGVPVRRTAQLDRALRQFFNVTLDSGAFAPRMRALMTLTSSFPCNNRIANLPVSRADLVCYAFNRRAAINSVRHGRVLRAAHRCRGPALI